MMLNSSHSTCSNSATINFNLMNHKFTLLAAFGYTSLYDNIIIQ